MLTNDDHDRTALYRDYAGWKAWSANVPQIAATARLDSAFAIELNRAGVPEHASVLEIGFGNGEFLDWCRAAGHRVCGIEIIPELVERASDRGHEVFIGGGGPPELMTDHAFDLIVAFDIFEHLTVEELRQWLMWAGNRLKPDGCIVARFPNGGSPFGLAYQSGDLTHRTSLSASSIEQLSRQASLRVISAHNAARPMGGGRSKLLKLVAYTLRDVIEIAVGLVYYGRRMPLDPNLTVILGRA